MKKMLIILIIVMIVLTGCKKKSKEIPENKEQKVKETIKCDDVEKSFEIKFDTLGGNEIQSIRYPGDNTLLPVVTRAGYIFKGWYYDKDYNDQVVTSKVSEVMVYEIKNQDNCVVGYTDLTLYAKWEEDKTAKKVEYYCDGGYTLNGTKCSRTEVIRATENRNCPEGYSGGGKGICHNESGKVNIDKMHCAEGSVGPDERRQCLTNPNELPSQDECRMHGYRWYNGVCYSNVGDILCPDGNYPSTASGNMDGGVDYYCSAYSDGREEFIHIDTTYVCPDGYVLSGTQCSRTIVVDAKTR